MIRLIAVAVVCAASCSFLACAESGADGAGTNPGDGGTGSDSDADTDTDADSDTDSDADSDTGTETSTDTGTDTDTDTTASCAAGEVFLNELHYDNTGADEGEGVEIAGPAGFDLNGWSIVLYNGNTSEVYSTTPLSSTLGEVESGIGLAAVMYAANGIENGAPDGIAIVDADDSVVQFLSYEGAFTAVGGPADGMTSTDIGVSESSDTLVGYSLQLMGSGCAYGDFSWITSNANFGDVNDYQSFGAE